MTFTRRDFMATALGALASGVCRPAAANTPATGFAWSYLAHFGVSSWKDVPLEGQ